MGGKNPAFSEPLRFIKQKILETKVLDMSGELSYFAIIPLSMCGEQNDFRLFGGFSG
jgi:hypothetical protein